MWVKNAGFRDNCRESATSASQDSENLVEHIRLRCASPSAVDCQVTQQYPMTELSKTVLCPQCGTERPSEKRNEPCPGCLLKMATEGKDSAAPHLYAPTLPSSSGQKFTPPTPEELDSLMPNLEI